jgi:hypothetical protein
MNALTFLRFNKPDANDEKPPQTGHRQLTNAIKTAVVVTTLTDA